MTLDVLPTVHSALIERAGVTARVMSEATAVRQLQFRDDWWSDRFWLILRDASLYSGVIDSIVLPNIPDKAGTRGELDAIMAKQKSAELALRRADIIEQAAELPAYLKRVVFADAERNAATSLVIDLAVAFCRPFIMHFKHQFKRPRPTQLEPAIRPVVDCPQHPAYPSGHSTQLHLIALVLREVTGREDIGDAMWSIADEVAENREYAGLHFHSDSLAGAVLSKGLIAPFTTAFDGEIRKAKAEWT